MSFCLLKPLREYLLGSFAKRPKFFKTGLSNVGFGFSTTAVAGVFTVSVLDTRILAIFFLVGESDWKKVAGIM